jgi:hypothetical protein
MAPDLETKQTAIKRLWTLVLKIIKNEPHAMAELQSVYLYPLVSITGEGGFTTEERQNFLNKLENIMDDQLKIAYAAPEGFIKGISDLLL